MRKKFLGYCNFVFWIYPLDFLLSRIRLLLSDIFAFCRFVFPVALTGYFRLFVCYGYQHYFCKGRASEAQLNMDVNLRRLPQNIDCISKFLESLADIMLVSVADEQSEVSGQTLERQDAIRKIKNV